MSDLIAAFRRRREREAGAGGAAALFKYTAGDSLAGWTTGRASVAYYYDVNGVVTQAGSGVMRDNAYYGGNRGWLLEPAVTNLCGQSDNFGVSWVNVCTATGGQADIYGGTSGFNLNDVTGTVDGSTIVPASFGSSTVKGFQIAVAKGASPAASGSTVLVIDTTATANRLLATITWPGAAPSVAMTTGTFLGAIGPIKNNYYVLHFLTTSVTFTDAHSIVVNPAGTAAETGDINVGGIQLENNAFTTMLQPTAAGANRVADTAPSRAHLSTPQPRALYAKCTALYPYSGNAFNHDIMSIGGIGGANDQYGRFSNTTSTFRGQMDNNSVFVAANSTGTPAFGHVMELRAASATDTTITGGISIDGGAEVTGVSAASAAYQGGYTQPNYIMNNALLASVHLIQFKDVPGSAISMAQCRSA